MRPVYMTTALFVEMSDEMVACKDSVKIKQLDTRLSSFSGFFNLAFTIGYSFIEKNDLYNAIIELVTGFSTMTCNQMGYNAGKLVVNMLEAKSPNEVFYNIVKSS